MSLGCNSTSQKLVRAWLITTGKRNICSRNTWAFPPSSWVSKYHEILWPMRKNIRNNTPHPWINLRSHRAAFWSFANKLCCFSGINMISHLCLCRTTAEHVIADSIKYYKRFFLASLLKPTSQWFDMSFRYQNPSLYRDHLQHSRKFSVLNFSV